MRQLEVCTVYFERATIRQDTACSLLHSICWLRAVHHTRIEASIVSLPACPATVHTMANVLASGALLPSRVRPHAQAPSPCRHRLQSHVLSPRKQCRAFRHTLTRSIKAHAPTTEAPAKSKARPGEKKGVKHDCAQHKHTSPAGNTVP